MKRIKVPLNHIRNKIAVEAFGYTQEDIDLFATEEEIADANAYNLYPDSNWN